MSIFCSLIPHLQTEKGHYFSYHRCVQTAMEKLGIGFCAYVSKGCSISPLPPHWVKFFPKKNFQMASKLFNAFARFRSYIHLFRQSEERRRFFFLECFREKELFLIGLAAFCFLKQKDQLLLLYRYDLQSFWAKGKILKGLTQILQNRLQTRFVALTDSELILQELIPWFSRTVYLLPIPHTQSIEAKNLSLRNRFRFWWAGEPRDSKGMLEIQSLLSIQDLRAKEMTLVFAQSAPLREGINEIQVERIPDILTRSEYEEQLDLADVILIPYHADTYRVGTSGVFVEAIVQGKVPFAKEGTWVAHELKKFKLSDLILDWSNPQLISCMIEIMQKKEIQEKLARMRERYKAYHCVAHFASSLGEVIQKAPF